MEPWNGCKARPQPPPRHTVPFSFLPFSLASSPPGQFHTKPPPSAGKEEDGASNYCSDGTRAVCLCYFCVSRGARNGSVDPEGRDGEPVARLSDRWATRRLWNCRPRSIHRSGCTGRRVADLEFPLPGPASSDLLGRFRVNIPNCRYRDREVRHDHNGRNTKQGRRRPRGGQARLEGVLRRIQGGPEDLLPRWRNRGGDRRGNVGRGVPREPREGRTSAARVASRLPAVREREREADLEHRVFEHEVVQPVLRGTRRRGRRPGRGPRVYERHERGDHLGGLHVLGERLANRIRRARTGVPQGILARRGEEARGGRGPRGDGTRSGQRERRGRPRDSERPFLGGELRWRRKWVGCRSSTTRRAGSSRSTTPSKP